MLIMIICQDRIEKGTRMPKGNQPPKDFDRLQNEFRAGFDEIAREYAGAERETAKLAALYLAHDFNAMLPGLKSLAAGPGYENTGTAALRNFMTAAAAGWFPQIADPFPLPVAKRETLCRDFAQWLVAHEKDAPLAGLLFEEMMAELEKAGFRASAQKQQTLSLLGHAAGGDAALDAKAAQLKQELRYARKHPALEIYGESFGEHRQTIPGARLSEAEERFNNFKAVREAYAKNAPAAPKTPKPPKI